MIRRLAVLACASLWSTQAWAADITLSGYLNDPANTALIASDGYNDLQAARFANDDEVARNVAVYALTVTTGGTFSFDSFGWGAGGAEPYFSIFDGSCTAANFATSNSIEDFFNIDFSFSRALAAGNYMLAIGVWMNMPFAENDPGGGTTLAQGFTALGGPGALGNSYYEVRVSSDDAVFDAAPAGGDLTTTSGHVPEPSILGLLGLGLAGMARARRAAR